MISEHSSAIVKELRPNTSRSGEPVELLIFGNDLTLAISAHALAVYRHPDCFNDPLGNGLVRTVDLPDDAVLQVDNGKLVAKIQSGCVDLHDGKILLILPNEIRLYPDRESALRNCNVLAQLPLVD